MATAPWRFVTGHNLPSAAFDELARSVGDGVAIERFRSDFPTLLRRCRLSVSQAGYNTVMEILATATPAVVVPFADGQETEQPLRARLLAERGLLTVVPSEQLSPARLAAAIDVADAAPFPAVADFDLDGARNSAMLLHRALHRTGP